MARMRDLGMDRVGLGALLAAVVLVLGSCGGTSSTDPARTFGASRMTGHVDRPGISSLASVERWLEVLEVPEGFRDPGLMDVLESRIVELRVVPVESLSSVGAPRTEPIDIHLSFFPGLDWALSNGGRAFLALEHVGDREMVGYAFVRTKEGEHFFAGQGGYEGLTLPARELLGERMDAVLDELVGITEEEKILELLYGPPSPTPSPPVILDPAETPKDVLRSLDAVSLVVERPEGWVGPFTLCTRIEDGWNECADMAGAGRLPDTIAYVGAARHLELWLLDRDANVLEPIQQLGTIDLRGSQKVLEGGDAVVIVRLGGTFVGEGADPPIVDPSVTLVEVVPWSEVLAHPKRYGDVLGT